MPERLIYRGARHEGLSESSARIEARKRNTSRPERAWHHEAYQAHEGAFPHRAVTRWCVVGVKI